jgi:hypothetical protein
MLRRCKEEEKWPGLQERLVDAMVRLEKALAPRVKHLKLKEET